jgi:hypothetical protein
MTRPFRLALPAALAALLLAAHPGAALAQNDLFGDPNSLLDSLGSKKDEVPAQPAVPEAPAAPEPDTGGYDLPGEPDTGSSGGGLDFLNSLGTTNTSPSPDTDTSSGGGLSSLTDGEIGGGLRQALRIGSERVVGQLGAADGFNLDTDIHIPLPDSLTSVHSALNMVGMSSLGDDLELRLNRAAERATPEAEALFFGAIDEMTLTDVREILTGPNDSATRYFQGKMSHPLAVAMEPIVSDALAEVGALQALDSMLGEYEALPFMPDVKTDLVTYVIEEALGGIFFYIAKEEAAIRENPVRRSTDLLRRVFGAV